MGVSPILQALYEGREADAQALAQEKPDEVSLLDAAALGDDTRLRLCLAMRWATVSQRSTDGFAPLHYAAFFGRYNALKTLLDEGADPSALSENAMNLRPLHAACATPPGGKSEKTATAMAASLIRAGADPNAAQEGGFTPLTAARQSGWTELEKLLRAAGANE